MPFKRERQQLKHYRRYVGYDYSRGAVLFITISTEPRQRDVAKRMGVSASKICRIEDSYDRDLAYADIMSYATALGIEPTIPYWVKVA